MIQYIKFKRVFSKSESEDISVEYATGNQWIKYDL